jgi:oligopeptide/dipeptide ABC transporter ATP-binding protein
MYRGSIVEQGDAESLYNDPQHPYTRMLLSAVPEIEEVDAMSRYGFDETRRESAAEDCDFYHRCPYATEACRKRPDLVSVLPEQPTEKNPQAEHFVRCWNPVRNA